MCMGFEGAAPSRLPRTWFSSFRLHCRSEPLVSISTFHCPRHFPASLFEHPRLVSFEVEVARVSSFCLAFTREFLICNASCIMPRSVQCVTDIGHGRALYFMEPSSLCLRHGAKLLPNSLFSHSAPQVGVWQHTSTVRAPMCSEFANCPPLNIAGFWSPEQITSPEFPKQLSIQER